MLSGAEDTGAPQEYYCNPQFEANQDLQAGRLAVEPQMDSIIKLSVCVCLVKKNEKAKPQHSCLVVHIAVLVSRLLYGSET